MTSESTKTSPLQNPPTNSNFHQSIKRCSRIIWESAAPPCTWWQDSSFDSGFCRLDDLLQNFPLRLPHEGNGTARAAGSGRSSNPVDVVFHRRRHREVYHLSRTAGSSTSSMSVQPARWQILTVLTPSMSRPRAATSVATRISICSSLKRLQNKDVNTSKSISGISKVANKIPDSHDGSMFSTRSVECSPSLISSLLTGVSLGFIILLHPEARSFNTV